MDFPNSTTLLTPVPHKIEYRIEERPPLFHHWPVFGMHIIIVFCLYVCLFIELHRNQAVYDPLSYPQSFFVIPLSLGLGFLFPSSFAYYITFTKDIYLFSFLHSIWCEM